MALILSDSTYEHFFSTYSIGENEKYYFAVIEIYRWISKICKSFRFRSQVCCLFA